MPPPPKSFLERSVDRLPAMLLDAVVLASEFESCVSRTRAVSFLSLRGLCLTIAGSESGVEWTAEGGANSGIGFRFEFEFESDFVVGEDAVVDVSVDVGVDSEVSVGALLGMAVGVDSGIDLDVVVDAEAEIEPRPRACSRFCSGSGVERTNEVRLRGSPSMNENEDSANEGRSGLGLVCGSESAVVFPVDVTVPIAVGDAAAAVIVDNAFIAPPDATVDDDGKVDEESVSLP